LRIAAGFTVRSLGFFALAGFEIADLFKGAHVVGGASLVHTLHIHAAFAGRFAVKVLQASGFA